MKVLPEFSELFNNARCLSSKIILFCILLGSNGKFHYLIKNVGNKRENMIKKQKDIEERKEFRSQLASKDREIDSLLIMLDLFKDKLAESEKNEELLSKLYESGVIDEHGTPKGIRGDYNNMN